MLPNKSCIGALFSSVLLTAGAVSLSAQNIVIADYLPHGTPDPPNPFWSPTTHRDIPWWFSNDDGPSDAYDISAVWAARLNRNNAAGYEAAIINTPGFTHLGGANPYGTPGGAFGTSADNITWGNNVKWGFSVIYDWNNASPTASFVLQSGNTTHTATANLGDRILDFVNGTGPYLEPHILSDVIIRLATIGNYNDPPTFTMAAVGVDNLRARIDSDPWQNIRYFNGVDPDPRSDLAVSWAHVPGGTSTTNPRRTEFLYLEDFLPNHEVRFEMQGELWFAWEGTVTSIPQSGVMFEVKLGDMNVFPGAEEFIIIPEPTSAALLGLTALFFGFRRSRR